jgi:ABC-2 type transport system permease protein
MFAVFAAMGLSLIIAGATLVYKRFQIANDTVLLMVMIFSASALPLIHVPRWWTAASHAFPLTDGVGSLYIVMIAHRSGTSAWASASSCSRSSSQPCTSSPGYSRSRRR